MNWEKDDFTNYHTAPSAWYKVEINGKVDIGMEVGRHEKISLQPSGMYKLVKEWLKSGHQLSVEQKQEILDILGKPKKSSTKQVLEKLEEISDNSRLKVEFDKSDFPKVDFLAGEKAAIRKSQEKIQDIVNKLDK